MREMIEEERDLLQTLLDASPEAPPLILHRLRFKIRLCDLALDLQAVRKGALEEAAKVADRHAKECAEKGLMTICLAHAATAIAIRALKREPNAAAELGPDSELGQNFLNALADDGLATDPAPTAVAEMVKRLNETAAWWDQFPRTAYPEHIKLLRDAAALLSEGEARVAELEKAADRLRRIRVAYKEGIVQSSNGSGYVDVLLEMDREDAALQRARSSPDAPPA